MTSTSSIVKIRSTNLLIVLWIVFSISLATFLLRDILFVPGLPYTRDLAFPYNLNITYSHLLSTWNDINSQQNLELNKIPLFFTFSAISGIIGSEFTIKLLFVIVLSSVSFIMFISLFMYFNDKVQSTWKLAAICCIPSLFYLLNPVVVDRISNHVYMVFGMALNPLVVLLFVRILERGARLSSLIIAASIMTIAGIVSSHNSFYLLPILLFCFLFYILNPKVNHKKRSIKSIGILFSIYILLNSYWIIPTLYHEFTSGIDPSYSISFKDLSKLSSRNSPLNVISLIGGGGWDSILQYPGTIAQISIYLSYLVPLFSLLAIVFFPKVRLVVLMAILFVILYFFALGTKSPLPLYQLLLESPIISGILWLFRDPSRSLIYLALVYSVLLAFVIQKVLGARYKATLKVSIIMILFFGIIISPAAYTFYNNAGNRLVSSQVPIEYQQLFNFLDNDVGDYNVLWLPFRQYFNYDWNSIEEEVAWNFYPESSPKPSIGIDSESNRNVSSFWQYINREILLDYRSNNLGELLNLYGVKYLVVHDDLRGDQEKEAKKILQILSFQNDLRLIKKIGPYYLFMNLKYDPVTSNFIATAEDTNTSSLSLMQSFRSSSINNINIRDFSKWNFSNSNKLSELSGSVLWEPRLNTSQSEVSTITIPLQNANIRNFEKLEVDIYPSINNTGKILSVDIFTNTSKITFEIKDLSLGKWNSEKLDLVNKRLALSSKSNVPNLMNVTGIGLKVFNKDYVGPDNSFFVREIRFIQDTKNGLYDSNIILDNWTQRKLDQSIISNISKIDPTKYKLEINATEPYVLGFVKSFSPQWTAEVKGDEKTGPEFNSFPLYKTLNGFWIDMLGQYEIEVEYKPQVWLLIGGYISTSTIIILTGFLIYGVLKRALDKRNQKSVSN